MSEQTIIEELQRQLRESKKGQEKAEKERQEERQRAEKAEKERQEERQRAEKAEKERQEERQRAEAAEKERQEERQRVEALEQQPNPLNSTNEKTLESFLHNSVEDPVKTIIDQLKQVEGVRSAFDLGNGIIFENHPHAISDLSEEVVYRDTPSTPPATPNHSLDLNRLRPDQICVYRSNNAGSETRTMIYISEYKPPHKLTAPHLRLGLRPMNIYKEVVNRKTIPTSIDPDGRFQYHAERLTAAAITQTYHYMIEGGLEYGLLTTVRRLCFSRSTGPSLRRFCIILQSPMLKCWPIRVIFICVRQSVSIWLLVSWRWVCKVNGDCADRTSGTRLPKNSRRGWKISRRRYDRFRWTSDTRRTAHPPTNLKHIRVSIDLRILSGKEDLGKWEMNPTRKRYIESQQNH
ncbi:hypothetical protein MCOR02_000856 [Pyricularia oryzae]|nr:hypothetical protein MCOR02_000856 [Pyricularia oryzae]